MTTAPAHSAANNVILVGIGTLGCELAAQCHSAPARRLLSFDADALAPYPGPEALCLAAEPENTADMDAEAMQQSAADAAIEILDAAHAHGNTLAVLLAAVGGHTGAIVIPALASELKAAGATVAVVALEPLPFEAAGRADLAARAINELANAADLVLVIPNRPLAELCDPAWPVARAIAHLKEKAADAVDHLIRALAGTACVGLQPAELRRSLADAGRGALATGLGAGDQRVEKAIRDACANSFLTHENCRNASAAILHLLGSSDLTLREVHAAADLLTQLVGRVPIQIGLTIDLAAGELIRATIIVTGIHPTPSDDLASELAAPAANTPALGLYDGVDLDVPAFLRRRALPQLRY